MAVGFTRAQYREAIARIFGFYTGTATGGTTSTLVDTRLARFANDFFNGADLYVKTTTDTLAPQGEAVFVTDFVAATGTLSVSPAFTVAPGAGDTYQLYMRITKADIEAALDLSLVGAEVATTLAAKTDSLDYYVTSAPKLLRHQNIIGVYRRSNNDVQSPPQEITGWSLEEAEGLLTLRLPYTLLSTDVVWLVYYSGEYSAGESDVVNLPVSLVRARAAKLLCEQKINDVSDREWWGTQLRYWGDELRAHEISFQRRPTKARMFNWHAASGIGLVEGGSWEAHLEIDTSASLIIGA
ncbi:MAG: hypothetical protein WC718_15900 [Phycisphaerales bacterium]|jgi:hypothetical protein